MLWKLFFEACSRAAVYQQHPVGFAIFAKYGSDSF
jgi:hypothetical protein